MNAPESTISRNCSSSMSVSLMLSATTNADAPCNTLNLSSMTALTFALSTAAISFMKRPREDLSSCEMTFRHPTRTIAMITRPTAKAAIVVAALLRGIAVSAVFRAVMICGTSEWVFALRKSNVWIVTDLREYMRKLLLNGDFGQGGKLICGGCESTDTKNMPFASGVAISS